MMRAIICLAWGYFTASGRSAQNMLLVLGLSAGVMVLIASLGIMNVLQQEIIGTLLDTQFHVQVHAGEDWEQVADDLARHPLVADIAPFYDQFVIAKTESGEQASFVLRMLAEQAAPAALRDSPSSILLTPEAASALRAARGEALNLVLLPEDSALPIHRNQYTVVGLQRSGGLENISRLGTVLLEGKIAPVLGIRLVDYRQDQAFLRFVHGQYGDVPALGWRSLYQVMFTALRVEKITLLLFITFIFIIIAFAEYQLFQRAVVERLPQIAMLRATGVSLSTIRLIFLVEGSLLGGIGLIIGASLGFLIVINIPQLSAGLLIIAFYLSNFVSSLLSQFSGLVYYPQVPSLLLTQQGQLFLSDIALVCAIAFLIPFIPVIYIMKRIAKIHPREVARVNLW